MEVDERVAFEVQKVVFFAMGKVSSSFKEITTYYIHNFWWIKVGLEDFFG